jgi:hypothetical protein
LNWGVVCCVNRTASVMAVAVAEVERDTSGDCIAGGPCGLDR